jgi:hypothetical protein
MILCRPRVLAFLVIVTGLFSHQCLVLNPLIEFKTIQKEVGYAVEQLIEGLRCKSEGRGFDYRSDMLRFFVDSIPLAAMW